MSLNIVAVNARFFDRLFLGFPGSALVAVAGLALFVRRLPAVALLAISVPLGYAIYWYHGVSFGARFWHPVYVAAIPSAALAIGWILDRLGAREWIAWAAIAFAASLMYQPIWNELSDHYWCVDAGLEEWLADAAGVDRGVVLLNDRGRVRRTWPLTKQGGLMCSKPLSQGSGLLYNDPFGEAELTWLHSVRDLAEVKAVAERHPGEPVYRVYRNLRHGAATIERWEGAKFGPAQPLEALYDSDENGSASGADDLQ